MTSTATQPRTGSITLPDAPTEKSLQAEASSAHARINVPLNLENWKSLPKDLQDDLLWFHQHLLDNGMSWSDATEALDYDRSTVFRVLKGTYTGSWDNIQKGLRSYRKLAIDRSTIQVADFVPNGISDLIFAALDYAVANNSITQIIGESRMGKTVAALAWRNENNHGRSVFVTAPPYGGTKAFLRRIADALGINKSQPTPQLLDAIARSFNKNRMLIIDEAHRLLPNDRRGGATNLEILRDIKDLTGCALALIATQRFADDLRKSEDYMYEQYLGRIGMPVRLPRDIKTKDHLVIVGQYVKAPSAKLIDACDHIANTHGRLGILTETLKVASRIAAKGRAKLTEEHVFKAIALRKQMMGEQLYAKK